MANNFFELLGIDWEELYEKFMNFQNTLVDKYNNLAQNFKKYDLDTEEGYENFIKDAAEYRKEVEKDDSVFNKKLISILDKCVKSAMENHEAKKETKPLIKEIVDAEVNRNNEEKKKYVTPSCTCENNKESIDWPSSHLNYKQTKNVWKLVDEYIETMVKPYVNVDDEYLDKVGDGLFEFAAWLLNKKED